MNSKHTVFLPKIVRNTRMFTYQWKWVNTCPGLSSSAALFVPLFLIVSLFWIVFPEMREKVLVGDGFLFCVAFMASPGKRQHRFSSRLIFCLWLDTKSAPKDQNWTRGTCLSTIYTQVDHYPIMRPNIHPWK